MNKYWLLISNFSRFLKWREKLNDTQNDVFKPTSFDFNLEQNFEKKEKAFREQFEIGFLKSEQNLLLISNTLKECDKKNLKDNRVIWNVANYIIILSYDLKVATYSLIKEKRQWNKLYFARQLCLILYECSKNIPNVNGKEFQEVLKKLNESDKIANEINRIGKEISKYYYDNKDFLYKVRNTATAHRDFSDTLNQLRTINTIEIEKVLRISLQFEELINQLGGAIQKAINAASNELK
jgi:hypothetical protein